MFISHVSAKYTCNPELFFPIASSVKSVVTVFGRKWKKGSGKKKKNHASEQPQWMATALSHNWGPPVSQPFKAVVGQRQLGSLGLVYTELFRGPLKGLQEGKYKVQMSLAATRKFPSIYLLWGCRVSCLSLCGPLPCSLCWPASFPSAGPHRLVTWSPVWHLLLILCSLPFL